MTNYYISDIHGCLYELKSLLKKIKFNIYKDKLWIIGDLIFKGPESIKILLFLYNIKENIKIILGNHDLFFIKNYFTNIKKKILINKKFYTIIKWLIKQKIIIINNKYKTILVHAGIPPLLNYNNIIKYSNILINILKKRKYKKFIKIYNNKNILKWNNKLKLINKLSFILHTFTNIRYCYTNNYIYNNYNSKIETNTKLLNKKKLIPWFFIKNKIFNKYNILFGHWSLLNKKLLPKNFFCLDTGCCYNKGYLTILDFKNKIFYKQKKK